MSVIYTPSTPHSQTNPYGKTNGASKRGNSEGTGHVFIVHTVRFKVLSSLLFSVNCLV